MIHKKIGAFIFQDVQDPNETKTTAVTLRLYADTAICGKLEDRQMIPCIGIQKQAVSTCADSNKNFSAYAVETDSKI